MKKIGIVISILLLLAINPSVFAQVKIMQSGAYVGQALRITPTPITVKGKLVKKYFNKGLYWFTILDSGTTHHISIIFSKQYTAGVEGETTTVANCFDITSNKWKVRDKDGK
ncbi:hypothetical protein [Pedobacter psychrodurus]|uniref:hypothetical protein n=1 Tax=Pedobacter psychrodurus TaxID=2530456 RepID=UPI00292F6A5D|nr:hypothetical protein [Pedobacter psychrodurus]